jgi:predicted nuclease of predicted toxin-antitoxin system
MLILDAQLSPHLAKWVTDQFGVPCFSARFLNLRDADDEEIFFAARERNAVVISKDDDFIKLLKRHGSPPKVIWLTCGNTSNQRLRELFTRFLSQAIQQFENGEELTELSGR